MARYYLCGIITEAESSDSDVEELTEGIVLEREVTIDLLWHANL